MTETAIQTPTEILVAAVPELSGYSAMDLDALWHGLYVLSLDDDRARLLDDIKAKGLAVDDGDRITLTERGQVALTALQRWAQETIVADAMETQPSNLRLAEAALRMQAEREADNPYHCCGLTTPAPAERERRGCAQCVADGQPRARVVGCILVDWYAAAVGRIHEGTEADSSAPALDPLEVAVLQRLARQPARRLADSMWTGEERRVLEGLRLRDPRLVDMPPAAHPAAWYITPEGRAALEASNGTR